MGRGWGSRMGRKGRVASGSGIKLLAVLIRRDTLGQERVRAYRYMARIRLLTNQELLADRLEDRSLGHPGGPA